MSKYRKIPVEIEAFQWTPGCELLDWAKSKLVESADYVTIDTLEGTMKASLGDYIIQGVEGEVYPCKLRIFEKTYEALTNA